MCYNEQVNLFCNKEVKTVLIALYMVIAELLPVCIAYGAAICKNFGAPAIMVVGIALIVGGTSGLRLCSDAGSAIFRYLIQGLGYIIRTLIQAIGWLLRHMIMALPVLWRNSKQFFKRANMSELVSSVLATVITVLAILLIIWWQKSVSES